MTAGEILRRHGPPTAGDPTRCRACGMLLPCDAIKLAGEPLSWSCVTTTHEERMLAGKHVYRAPGVYHECDGRDCRLSEQLDRVTR